MKMIGNISKFSWGELTSNSNGKTSGSGTSGFITIIIGLIGFLYSVVLASFGKLGIEYVYASVGVIGIGAGLLGWRKKLANGDVNSDPTDIINTLTQMGNQKKDEAKNDTKSTVDDSQR